MQNLRTRTLARLNLQTLEDRCTPSHGGIEGPRIELATGHLDLFGAFFKDGILGIEVHDETASEALGEEVHYEPEQLNLIIGPAALTTRPASATFNFLGAAPGRPIYVVPPIDSPDLPKLGAAAEEITPGTFASFNPNDPRAPEEGEYVLFELVEFKGPGHFSVWVNDAFARPIVYFSTADGVNVPGTPSDTIFVLVGTHADLNFAFSKPGEYEFKVRAKAFLGPGQTNPILSTDYEYKISVNLDAVTPPPPPVMIVGTDAGGGPAVKIIDTTTGAVQRAFFAYDPSFTGGVRVATGDVNGDGIADFVTAAGFGGGPHIQVFDGATGANLQSFFAFDPSVRGGTFVAVGDLDGDGLAELVVGAGPGGGPHVKVFDGLTGREKSGFFAFDSNLRTGVQVAVGDMTGNGRAEIITGAGDGGAPHVKTFDGLTFSTLQSFFAFDLNFRGGVSVAVGDINGDGRAELIAGAGAGGGPNIKAFDLDGRAIMSFFAFDPGFTGGVRVSTIREPGDDRAKIIVATGPGASPTVRQFDVSGRLLDQFAAFEDSFRGGIFIG